MTKNDRKLLTSMIEAGRFNWDIYQLLTSKYIDDSKQKVKELGNKWVCHPDNRVKKLDIPLPVLSDSKFLKTFRGKK